MTDKTLTVLALTLRLFSAEPAHADVNVGITIGAPPPVIVTAPPQIVVVPGSTVAYVPAASFNVFVYGGRYYSFHNGGWFVASRPGAPWTVLAVDRVPRPVVAVPVTYYKIPPGHARKMGGEHPKGPKGGRGNH